MNSYKIPTVPKQSPGNRNDAMYVARIRASKAGNVATLREMHTYI